LAPDALDLLIKHSWDGNVRELENAIERAFVVCHDREILVRHLPPEIRESQSRESVPQQSDESDPLKELAREEIEEVLSQTDWNVAKSAKKLGIARNTLYLRMKNLGLVRPDA